MNLSHLETAISQIRRWRQQTVLLQGNCSVHKCNEDIREQLGNTDSLTILKEITRLFGNNARKLNPKAAVSA
jgi:adenine C2-methylase RlmN of 23S rRNA A2503 and tRNA A37